MDLPFTLQDMRQGWECPLCAGGEFQVQDELQILIRCAHGNVEQATRETDPESQGNTGARGINWEMIGRRCR